MILGNWDSKIVNGCYLTGYLPMSQKVVQIQNRQFSWNLCQSTPSWSKLTTQNIFDLWWPLRAVAVILNSEATNKMNMSSVMSYGNVSLRSFIFTWVMKNIKRWGLTRPICGSFTTKPIWPKSTLFTKMSSEWPEIKNLLYIGKWINGKFSILGLLEHFLKGSQV